MTSAHQKPEFESVSNVLISGITSCWRRASWPFSSLPWKCPGLQRCVSTTAWLSGWRAGCCFGWCLHRVSSNWPAAVPPGGAWPVRNQLRFVDYICAHIFWISCWMFRISYYTKNSSMCFYSMYSACTKYSSDLLKHSVRYSVPQCSALKLTFHFLRDKWNGSRIFSFVFFGTRFSSRNFCRTIAFLKFSNLYKLNLQCSEFMWS